MSAILHCLIHCAPLQRFFLYDVGHNHVACNIYRMMNLKVSIEQGSRVASANAKNKTKSVCLACEMDKLFLRYVGSTRGIDVLTVVDTSSLYSAVKKPEFNGTSNDRKIDVTGMKGSPLLTADMLTAAWKCGGMKHLAGYEQRDAHEFLHGFLEILGKHMQQFRDRVHTAINSIRTPQSLKRKMEVKRSDGTTSDMLRFYELASIYTHTTHYSVL
jgi:ubiquitin carboxyl-terminal hydrolase 22/27/51